jgi:hypothetical protein
MDRTQQLENVVFSLYHQVQSMNAQIASLVTQVATNVAADSNAAVALKNLATQITALQTQLATAIAAGLGADDVAALTKAVSDLATSATALAAATPAVTA